MNIRAVAFSVAAASAGFRAPLSHPHILEDKQYKPRASVFIKGGTICRSFHRAQHPEIINKLFLYPIP